MPDKIFKQFVAIKESTDDDNTAVAAISTDSIDRDKEVLVPKGVNLDNFNKNPVVLWAHDYSSTPVGSTKKYGVKKGRKIIKAKWEWADTDKALEIKKLWDGGFLNAVSVGFIVSKSHEPTPDDIKKTPEWAEVRRVIDEWELLEFSIVPVPANPDALAGIKELKLSDATQKELGIVEETTVFVEKETEETNNENTEIEVKEKESVIVTAQRILVPHRPVKKRRFVRIVINPKEVSSEAIKMLKGRIY